MHSPVPFTILKENFDMVFRFKLVIKHDKDDVCLVLFLIKLKDSIHRCEDFKIKNVEHNHANEFEEENVTDEAVEPSKDLHDSKTN